MVWDKYFLEKVKLIDYNHGWRSGTRNKCHSIQPFRPYAWFFSQLRGYCMRLKVFFMKFRSWANFQEARLPDDASKVAAFKYVLSGTATLWWNSVIAANNVPATLNGMDKLLESYHQILWCQEILIILTMLNCLSNHTKSLSKMILLSIHQLHLKLWLSLICCVVCVKQDYKSTECPALKQIVDKQIDESTGGHVSRNRSSDRQKYRQRINRSASHSPDSGYNDYSAKNKREWGDGPESNRSQRRRSYSKEHERNYSPYNDRRERNYSPYNNWHERNYSPYNSGNNRDHSPFYKKSDRDYPSYVRDYSPNRN